MIESLEKRSLLTITFTFHVDVANLPKAEADAPVRVINALAYLTYTPTSGLRRGMETTVGYLIDPSGNCEVALSDLSAGDRISSFRIIAQGNFQPAPGQNVAYEVDRFAPSNTTAGRAYEAVLPGIALTVASKVYTVPIDAAKDPTTAAAFVIFSALDAPLRFAKSIGASLPSRFPVNYPYDLYIPAGSKKPASNFDPTGAKSKQSVATLNFTTDVLAAPDSIAHEFGHLVEAANGFANSSTINVGHGLGENIRQLVQDPKNSSRTLPSPASRDSLDEAFSEGWADYFAVAARGVSTLPIAWDESFSSYYGISLYNSDKGRGEDDELSVGMILYRLAYDGINTLGISKNMGAVSPMTDNGLFQFLAKSGIQDLAQFYAKLSAAPAGDQGQNKYLAALGYLAMRSGISPVPGQLVVDTKTLNFTVPFIFKWSAEGKKPEAIAQTTFQANAIQVEVFSALWTPVCICGVGGKAGVVPYYNSTITVNDYGEGALVMGDTAWNQIIRNGGVYWVVQARSDDTRASQPVYFWSAPKKDDLRAHVVPTSFESDASSNNLALTYKILPDYPATISPFTINVYAVETGSFEDPRFVGNEIAMYTEDDPNYLTGTATHNQFTIDIPASAIDYQLLEGRGSKGQYIVAEIDFSDGSPAVLARFQGGAFQTADPINGTVFVYGGASLDDDTPDSADYTTAAAIASAGARVAVSESTYGSNGDTTAVSQTFPATCDTVNAYVYDNDSTITGSGLGPGTSLNALGGDGNDTFSGGQGNDSLVAGNGTDVLSDLDGNDVLTVGDGNDSITAGNGNDWVTAGGGDNTITAQGGNDSVTVGSGNNVISLGGGNNSFMLGGGNNSITAGDGGDHVWGPGENGDNTVSLGNGNDSVTLGNGNNMISLGTNPDDGINVGNGDNDIRLAAGAGISLGCGDNTVHELGPADLQESQYIGVNAAGGNNVFFLDAESTCNSTLSNSSGVNDLVLTDIGPGIDPTIELPYIYLRPSDPLEATIYLTGNFAFSFPAAGGTGANSLTLDNGGTVDGLDGVPAGCNITLENGTSLNLEGQSITVGTLTLDGGTITNGTITATSYDLENGEIDANLAGGPVTVSNGYVASTGVNSFSAATVDAGGTLAVNSDAALGASTGVLTLDGTLQAWADFSSARSISVGGSSASIDTNGNAVTLTGAISGGGVLTVDDSGGGGGLLVLSGGNSYTGGTTIAGGMVQFSRPAALPANGLVLIQSGGALEATGAYPTAAAWLGAANTIDTNSSGALALTAADESSTDAINLTGYNSLSLGAASDVTYRGSIAPASQTYQLGGGPGALTVATPLTGGNDLVINGNVVLTGNNSFTGGITINPGGTLVVGDGAIPSSASITDNGTLEFDNSGSLNFAGAIGGAGSVAMIASGTVEFSGTNNTWAAGTTITSGMVEFDQNALPANGLVLVQSRGALAAAGAYSDAAAWLNSGMIDPNSGGALALVSSTAEDIDLSSFAPLSLGAVGNVTYSGVLIPYSGSYELGGGPGTLTVDSASLGPGNSLVVNGNVVLDCTPAGGGTLIVDGSSSLTVSAGSLAIEGGVVNDGAIFVAGTLHVASGGVLDNESGTVTVFGGTLSLVAATFTNNGQLFVSNGSLNIDPYSNLSNSGAFLDDCSLNNSGMLHNLGNICITSGGVFTDSGWTDQTDGGIIDNYGSMVESGYVDGGTYIGEDGSSLESSPIHCFSNLSDITLNSGALLTADSTSDLDALIAAGVYTSGTIMGLNIGNSTITYASNLSGDVGLAVFGTGYLILDGNNIYTGTTYLEGPIVQMGSSNAIGTGNLVVDAGMLDMNGNALSVGTLSGAGGGISNSNASKSNLTVNQAVDAVFMGYIADGGPVGMTLEGSGQLAVEGGLQISGGLTIYGGARLNLGAYSYVGGGAINLGTLTVDNGSMLSLSGLTNVGTLNVINGSILSTAVYDSYNSGTIYIGSGCYLTMYSNLENYGTVIVDGSVTAAASLYEGSTVDNYGDMELGGAPGAGAGYTYTLTFANLNNYGTLNIRDSELEVSATLLNGGTINMDAASCILVDAWGTVMDDAGATTNNSGVVYNFGTWNEYATNIFPGAVANYGTINY
jgi:autotransporter-associated beta strand protein